MGPRCGTRYSYIGLGCRCVLCTDAQAKYQRQWVKRHASDDPTSIPHGTVNGYNNYGCRCADCTEAKSVENRRRYRARVQAAR